VAFETNCRFDSGSARLGQLNEHGCIWFRFILVFGRESDHTVTCFNGLYLALLVRGFFRPSPSIGRLLF
jgi:hypothetical protein